MHEWYGARLARRMVRWFQSLHAPEGRRPRRGASHGVFVAFAYGALAMVLASTSCTDDQRVLVGGFGPSEDAGGTPEFVAPDAAEAGPDPTAMCATTECPSPYADCPTSTHRCGTNLRDDVDNCGACGRQCPDNPVLRAYMNSGAAATMNLEWDCVHGECVSRCLYHLANCNGFLEDGCEVDVTCDPENCGACGNRCAPGEACVFGTCGCAAGLTACGAGQCAEAECVDTKDDEFNCGGCGIVCSASRPDLDLKDHMDWGCSQGTCQVICVDPWAECNGNPDDGCETSLTTNENCGACGNACKSGETCFQKHCVCDPSKTNCCEDGQTLCNGQCVSLSSNPDHCGACGNKCPAVELDGGGNVRVTCEQGTCGFACDPGYADCNKDPSDGCEAWLRFDPNHCGKCGNACNPGQPCVEGACAMAPCDGGTTTPQ